MITKEINVRLLIILVIYNSSWIFTANHQWKFWNKNIFIFYMVYTYIYIYIYFEYLLNENFHSYVLRLFIFSTIQFLNPWSQPLMWEFE